MQAPDMEIGSTGYSRALILFGSIPAWRLV